MRSNPPDEFGAGGGNRTHTGGKAHRILSPARLPVSPLRPWVRLQFNSRILFAVNNLLILFAIAAGAGAAWSARMTVGLGAARAQWLSRRTFCVTVPAGGRLVRRGLPPLHIHVALRALPSFLARRARHDRCLTQGWSHANPLPPCPHPRGSRRRARHRVRCLDGDAAGRRSPLVHVVGHDQGGALGSTAGGWPGAGSGARDAGHRHRRPRCPGVRLGGMFSASKLFQSVSISGPSAT